MSKEFQEIAILILMMSLLFVAFAVAIIFSVFRYKQRQQKHSKEKEELRSQFARTLLQSQLEIKEQTLQHIAFELHDNLGQIASLIKINLNTLQLKNTDQAMENIAETKDLVRQLIADLKSLSLNLNSSRVAQVGLLKGIENEVARVNKTGQFEATFLVETTIPQLDSNTTIILYRMVQEILNNAIKHSAANRLSVAVRATEKMFTLEFSDDGVGFDVAEKMNGGGSGLFNLRTRAELIKAVFSIRSSPHEGTRISIDLPI